MADNDLRLMAHLMRRAGFGATREELERLAKRGYDATVETLLDPESQPDVDMYPLYRRLPQAENSWSVLHAQTDWIYRMLNTRRPLQEKVALFWHYVFATAASKVEHSGQMANQIALFRKHGMGSYRRLLVEMAKDPAMIFWLDNQDNHKRAPNENWGRELLELFSMGVNNYTENDVYECSRAFTGWSFEPTVPSTPWGNFPWVFKYRAEDHDGGVKTFLGQTGRFNGEDIIDIVVRQPACAAFICRHLYNFFVAEEPQVPAWNIDPPGDPEAVGLLARTFVESDYEIKPVLRVLFNSDFFKEAAFRKVKSPTEVVIGALKLTGALGKPVPEWGMIGLETEKMGQALMNPPSVEGWHTGKEWINSGSLMNRVNFVADYARRPDLPGNRRNLDWIVSRSANGGSMPPEDLVDRCLDLMGPLEVPAVVRDNLVAEAAADGELSYRTAQDREDLSRRVGNVMALIAGTREYQFG